MSKRISVRIGNELRFLESQYMILIKEQSSYFVISKQNSCLSPIRWKLMEANVLLVDEKKH